MNHTPRKCTCDGAHCPICAGGLLHCTTCGGAEASAPTECPGLKMTQWEEAAVQAGLLDFRGGQWILGQAVRQPHLAKPVLASDLDTPPLGCVLDQVQGYGPPRPECTCGARPGNYFRNPGGHKLPCPVQVAYNQAHPHQPK